jgi:hypothetical protein
MEGCLNNMFHKNKYFQPSTSLYKPFSFTFRLCVGVVDHMDEAQREGPKALTNYTIFSK